MNHKTNGRFVLSALALVLAFSLVGCGKKQDGKTAEQMKAPILIGANVTLTGKIAFWGQQIQKGLDLAATEANANQGAQPIKVLYQDNQGEMKNGISIFHRFATVDKVSAVISIFSPISTAVRPLADQYKIPLVATVVSADGFGLPNQWTFQDFPAQSQLIPPLASYAYNTLELRSAATFVVNDDYGRDGAKVFSAEFQKLGGKIVASETVDAKEIDARGQLTKLVSSKPDCLFMVARDASLGTCVRQARELGFKGIIVGPNAFDAPPVWETAGAAADGVVFSSTYLDYQNDPAALAFANRFETAYHVKPDWVAVYGYTIGQYLFKLAQDTKGDPSKLRDALASLDVASLRGHLRMNASRALDYPIGIYRHEGNSNTLLNMDKAGK